LKALEGVFDSLLFLSFGVIAGALAFYAYVDFSHSRFQSVVVPEVQGLSGREARERIERAGLVPVFNGKICERVVGTSPREGMIVRKGRRIEVHCLDVAVEDALKRIVGLPFECAAGTLRKLGFDYLVSRMPLPGEDGRVVDAEYSEGEVFILVDSGDPPVYTLVPDLTGMNVEEAERVARDKGLRVRKIGNGEKVLDQSPAPGSVSFEVVLITE